jgi:hypothetical protein
MAPPPKSSASFARVAEMHGQGNRRSKDDWELYRRHRERLTRTIDRVGQAVAGDAAPNGRLCLLGAGNCNDVQLDVLAQRFQTIHLVDIDGAALDRARARQLPEVRSRLELHPGVDLTGLLGQLDAWGGEEPDLATQQKAIDAGTAAATLGLPAGTCDVAVSCCLMSQLGWSLEAAVEEVARRQGRKQQRAPRPQGGEPTVGVEIRLVMLTIHLRTLAALVRPGGAALLASDITSSDLYPLDDLGSGGSGGSDGSDGSDADLSVLADQLVRAQQVIYAGANPVLTSRVLRKDPVLKEAFGAPVALAPWLWTGQFERTYLVYPQQLPRK